VATKARRLTHPYIARAWAKTGADLRVPVPGQAKKVAMLGAPITSNAPTHRPHRPDQAQQSPISSSSIGFMVSMPGQPTEPVVIVEDSGPIHMSKLSTVALAARAHWLPSRAAHVCAGTQRHRGSLARPEGRAGSLWSHAQAYRGRDRLEARVNSSGSWSVGTVGALFLICLQNQADSSRVKPYSSAYGPILNGGERAVE
jgi:hypothetical protein